MRVSLLNRLTTSVHQMGLTEAHATVEIKRVICLARRFSYCLGGGVGELIAGAYYEIIEGVLRIESGIEGELFCGRCGCTCS